MVCLHQTYPEEALTRLLQPVRPAQVLLDGLAKDTQLTKMLTTHRGHTNPRRVFTLKNLILH